MQYPRDPYLDRYSPTFSGVLFGGYNKFLYIPLLKIYLLTPVKLQFSHIFHELIIKILHKMSDNN